MKTTTNILFKIFFFLILAAGGGSGAWADRVAPEFVSQVDITSKWYQLFFVNSGGEYGYVYRNATDGRMLRTQNSTAGSATNYFWQFVGASNDFVLINYDGYYAKYDNTRYVTTSVQAEATHFSIVENTTNGNDCWGIRRNGGQFWNPQNQEGQRQIREWRDNDGGARLRFIPQDVSSFVPLQAKDPTTFAQLQDGWYAITVAQAGANDGDLATAVAAGRRGIVPNPVPANMEAEGNTLYGLNVVTPHANPGLNLVHVTKEGSNTYIQSLFGLYFNTSNQAQYAKTNENNPTITGNLSNVKFGNWHTFHNGAAIGNNGNSNIYTLTPYVLDSELAAQTAPVTIYRVESSGKAVPTYNAGNTYTNRNSLPTVTCRNTAVLRSEATVGLGGYFIFSNGYVPSAADFEVHDIGLDNFDVEVTGTGAIKTLRFMTAGEPWRVIITGDKRDDEQITYRNNLKFSTHQPSRLASGEESATVGDGGYFYFNTGITREQLLDCDFTSNAASRGAGKSFVYGPVIDMTTHTITCEIREAITAMPATEGWYQLKYDVSTGNNVAATNRYTNADEGNTFTIPTRSARRFYPTMPLGGISGRSEYLEYGTYPTDATTPQTFFKLIPSSGGLKVMSIDGRYVTEGGAPSTTPTYTNPASYVDGEVDFRHWYPFPTLSNIMGKSTNTHNYFYTAPAKFADDRYEFYEVHIEADQVANDARVTYSGSTTNYSKDDVYRNGFFVFPKGYVPNVADFRVDGATFVNMTMDIEDAGAFKTLHFKEASTESWFTIKNHRRSDGYLSVANAGLEENQQMKWGVSAGTTAAEYWQLKADGDNGYRIINKAYGEDYVLGIENTNNKAYVRMYHISEANATNTHFDKVPSNTTGEFCIMLHGNHGIALHDIDSRLGTWSNGNENTHKNDLGSAFVFTKVDDAIINAIPDYTVYKVDVQSNGRQLAVYGGSQENVIGQTAVQEGRYMLLKSDYVAIPEDFNYSEVAVSNSDTEPSYKILTLSGEEKLPMIIHRQHAIFDKLAGISEDRRPDDKFIQVNEGMLPHPYASNFTGNEYKTNDLTLQNTSVFHITQYAKQDGTTLVYLPFTRSGQLQKISKYQRWYDYTTERLLDDDVVSGLSGFTTYLNGRAITNSGNLGSANIKLPSGKQEIIVGVDASEFNDFRNDAEGNLIEPSLSMRVIIHVKDAALMADALKTSGDDWWEEKTYIVPNVKNGSAQHHNNVDLLPLDMPFSNYWIRDGSAQNNLMRIVAENGNYNTLSNNLAVEVEGTAAEFITAGIFKDATTGILGPLGVASNHFIYYKINGDGLTRKVPAGSQAIVKVYARNGVNGTKYQLAKFTLNFQAGAEPLAITSVVGNPTSTRSREYFEQQGMKEVASLTFGAKQENFGNLAGVGGGNHYAFPIDFTRTSYAYSPDDAFGGYRITKQGYGMKVLPVSLYERNIKTGSTSLDVDADDYYIYIDAAESPGQVASIPLDGNLCPGTRLYFYGWLNSQNPLEAGNATSASVILELIGRKGSDESVLASYAPGVISDAAYTQEGEVVRSVKDGKSASAEPAYSFSYNKDGHGADQTRIAAWQSVGFSYLVTESGFDQFELRIINNCYSTAGGDYSLDDFRVFANPPRGNVDFTTPLCSDKVRHAKIHADYDMLVNMGEAEDDSEENPEETPDENGDENGGDSAVKSVKVSYCFLDAEIFDSYSYDFSTEYPEDGTVLTITDVLEEDEQGNHNLKSGYRSGPAFEMAKELINQAFGAALVGSRCSQGERPFKDDFREDHGFHSYEIDMDYENLPAYRYNDSKGETAYREVTDNGVHRIVFKENVVRGEEASKMRTDTDGHKYYPYLRPSRTYYLVFTTTYVDDDDIQEHTVGTNTFHLHDDCSFFGKFTTTDPMHVILDNADIESDLPMKAICHGESAEFQFDMPALKADKPVYDEEYCISAEDLDGKMVPESYGSRHYRFESSFNNEDVYGTIKNLPYDWWLGGKYDEAHSYRGTIEGYRDAVHPTLTYIHPEHDHTHAADYKKDGEPVNIALAMENFRFYYPEFGLGKTDKYGVNTFTDADWEALTPHDYNNESGYSLLQSEINAIRDLVEKGIIVLYRNTFDMPLTLERAEELNLKELSDMMEAELNTQVLALALKLNDPSIVDRKPLRQLEASVLYLLSDEGCKALTYEEFDNLSHSELKTLAATMVSKNYLTLTSDQIDAMSESDLYKAIEAVLDAMDDNTLFDVAKTDFPDLTHEERAYLVVRALNLLSKEVYASMTAVELQNTELTRQKLREMMIKVFHNPDANAPKIDKEVLLKMLDDTAGKLTEEERAALLKDKNLENETELADLIESALAKITDKVIKELSTDRYIHFTLLPIMPTQDYFVDEPYIFCPEPRGVKVRITTNSPRMLDGFADMPYPDDMDNVPVRLGLSQIAAVPYSNTQNAKTLRMPLRGLGSAQKNGTHEMHLQGSGYVDNLYLVETNDPNYQYGEKQAGVMKPAILIDGGKPGDQDAYRLVAKVKDLHAVYTSDNNYMDLQFDPAMKFHEGYTYRLGFNFMEFDEENAPTISCYGTMYFDMKIVPEYQKWTGAVSDDWTNDRNWKRADRSDLHADNLPTGEVITGSTAYAKATADDAAADRYPTNAANKTSESFVPMAFTNTLIAAGASKMPSLYSVIAPKRSHKETVAGEEVTIPGYFLGGTDPSAAGALQASASEAAKYEMEVYDATGTWHNTGNYECGLFGTYVAKGITFEPATSLHNAHLLSYQKAWVEYELNTNRWYTIASPLQETFSGEWYSPTGSGAGKGKQLTPHFYSINYDVNVNNRFNPAYYQRSWDQGTANVFRCFDGSHSSGGFYLPNVNPLNVAIGLDWSHVYNDVNVNYSAGGFSVKPTFDDDSNGQVLVRMPKADASYLYFDKGDETIDTTHRGDETDITRGNGHYRLCSDMLKTAANFTQSVTNANGAENPYYLVANPFMAPMDMDEFFAENTQFEAGKFWIMTDNLQSVNVKTAEGWFSTTGDDAQGAVAPLQAFFVKLSTPTADAVTVKYTAAMQKSLATAEAPVLKTPAQKSGARPELVEGSSLVFHIEATDADGDLQSQAMVAFVEGAHNTYCAGEDAELLLDGNTADEVATVFTAAPTTETDEAQAMQFNALSREVTIIPVGIIAPTDETETTLTFTGITALTDVMEEAPYLYDAANGSFTALDEESALTVKGSSAGRYFIVSGMHLPYDNGDDIDNADGESLDSYNLHGIRVATPQHGNVTIRGSRKEFRR